ncbi:16S rRNA (guanine966-N2)-methyltransferase [Spiroplasma litorale]|uniref:16S rRNA (Guanine966-N2)-methyltransferase n=1 Tax=Spiroplasma litorale TaxID=216942 RepID=A0A0K1W0Y2_9MOLU|nr:16S rRNA (guanine(966)-N(2))-methyltransferase RsmD [Spiroplasma litorale]AKX33841.1 16S rRNA (guanine966-N2)-methyltransferase [Spiroplasma litorale]
MKVISGKFKGRKLNVLEGLNTRPTLTRVKEDIFNVLNNYFIYNEKICLDLFAGSGALGIEAISRGVKHVYFNEHNKDAIKVLNSNLEKIGKEDFTILNLDFKDALKYMLENNIKIDLLFLDPPFKEVGYYKDFFEYISKVKIINNYGILIIESKEILEKNLLLGYVCLKYKFYKNKHLYIIRLEE